MVAALAQGDRYHRCVPCGNEGACVISGGWAGDEKNARSLMKNAICRKDEDVEVWKCGSVVF